LQFDSEFIPPERYAGDSWGIIKSPDLQSELHGAVVTVAGHDHPVGALGSGATAVNQIFNSTGTADVIYRCLPTELSDKQRLDLANMGVSSGRNVLRGITSCIGGSRGGLVLRRALDLVGGSSEERRNQLDDAWNLNIKFKDVIDLNQSKSISNDISIVVTGDAGPIELWAAALSYMAQENKKFLLGLEKVVGKHESAIAAGGWIRMKSVREIKSLVIANLSFSDVKEAGAIGAAYMASWAGQQKGDSLLQHINQRTEKFLTKNNISEHRGSELLKNERL
jgi:sugar (pentulose or hexulose) kinase